MEDNEGKEIDIEHFLQQLLAISGDEKLRLEAVEQVAKSTNLPPEKVELAMKAAIEVLMKRTRSN